MDTETIKIVSIFLGSFGTLVGSMFGFAKYITKKHDSLAKTFLEYIQTKNGITERMGKEFSEAVERMNKEHTDAMKEIIREVKTK